MSRGGCITKLAIEDDFTGSMIGSHDVEGNKAIIELKKDPITRGYLEDHDYNLHFNFRIRNKRSGSERVDFFIGCRETAVSDQHFGWLWIKNEGENEYRKLEIDGKMRVPGEYHFTLDIKPGLTYISNYIPLSYKSLIQSIESLASSSGAVERLIGRSVEGRDIKVYEYVRRDDAPYLLFLSGFHPPEGDLFAIEAIAEILSDENFRNMILDHFNISLIPLVNPDGYHHMTQGSNFSGINFYWKFFGNSKEECPESHAIWDYCRMIRPLFYMDFHAFTFQNNEPRPYNVPPILHANRGRTIVQKKINRALSRECNLDHKPINQIFLPAHIIAPNLLSTRLIREMDTIISPKFHVHVKYGVLDSKDLVKRCVKEIMRTMMEMREDDRLDIKPGSAMGYRSIFALNRIVQGVIKKVRNKR